MALLEHATLPFSAYSGIWVENYDSPTKVMKQEKHLNHDLYAYQNLYLEQAVPPLHAESLSLLENHQILLTSSYIRTA